MIERAAGSVRQRLFAKIMHHADGLNHEHFGDRKRDLFADLAGRVLELGPGTGVNFRYLPAGIEWIGIEPNPAMHPFLREEAESLGFSVDLRAETAEGFELGDESVDAVISTLVLCSVTDLGLMLGEIHRVLRPGGRFVFFEHVGDRPGSFRRMVQNTVKYTPWTYFSDGCRPDRAIGAAIDDAGFSSVEYDSYMHEGLGVIGEITKPHVCGIAIR